MQVDIPLRGVQFFSNSASFTIRGPSGMTYQFFKDKESRAVTHPADVASFRGRTDIYEKGNPSAMDIDRLRSNKPASYHRMGKSTLPAHLLQPPTPEMIAEAQERQKEYARILHQRSEADSARVMAEKGVGTPEAQAERKLQALAAKGIFPDRDRGPRPPSRSETFGSKPAAPPKKKVEIKAEEPIEEIQKDVGEFVCEFCGRKFPKIQGYSIHTRLHCKQNPNSTASLKLAEKAG